MVPCLARPIEWMLRPLAPPCGRKREQQREWAPLYYLLGKNCWAHFGGFVASEFEHQVEWKPRKPVLSRKECYGLQWWNRSDAPELLFPVGGNARVNDILHKISNTKPPLTCSKFLTWYSSSWHFSYDSGFCVVAGFILGKARNDSSISTSLHIKSCPRNRDSHISGLWIQSESLIRNLWKRDSSPGHNGTGV